MQQQRAAVQVPKKLNTCPYLEFKNKPVKNPGSRRCFPVFFFPPALLFPSPLAGKKPLCGVNRRHRQKLFFPRPVVMANGRCAIGENVIGDTKQHTGHHDPAGAAQHHGILWSFRLPKINVPGRNHGAGNRVDHPACRKLPISARCAAIFFPKLPRVKHARGKWYARPPEFEETSSSHTPEPNFGFK